MNILAPLDETPGKLILTKNMLFTWQDIEEACIKLNCDNHKMWDQLSGFPNKKNKCVGVLVETDLPFPEVEGVDDLSKEWKI